MDPNAPEPLPVSINVKLQFGKVHQFETELIEDVAGPHLSYNNTSEILLAPLIAYLRALGYPLTNSIVWYYSPTARLNVYCGNEPLAPSVSVPVFDLKEDVLSLVCRDAIRNEFGTVVTIGTQLPQAQCEEDPSSLKTMRRTKERKIGYIIEKVSEWRALYCGDGNSGKKTLEEAAIKVGISKKSLDDYLLQLRFGRKLGFNFQEHKDDKVGVLRAYVKKFKSLQSQLSRLRPPVPKQLAKTLQEPGTPCCKHNRCCYPPFALPFKRDDDQIDSSDVL